MTVAKPAEEYLTANDVARRLRVDPATVHRWMAARANPLPSIKVVGVRRIRAADLEEWLERQR